MKYSLYATNYSISVEDKVFLESKGAKVPYNAMDTSVNNYVYVPEDINLNETLLDLGMVFLSDSVSEAEVNKHLNKVKEVNTIKVGDWVFTKKTKNLRMKVLEIDGDEAILSIKLRGVNLLYRENINLIYSKELEESLELNTINIGVNDKIMVLDFDYIPESKSNAINYGNLFIYMLRAKTGYQGYELVFLNPSENSKAVADDFGIASVFGAPGAVKNYKPEMEKILVTEDISLADARVDVLQWGNLVETKTVSDPEVKMAKLLKTIEREKRANIFFRDYSEEYLWDNLDTMYVKLCEGRDLSNQGELVELKVEKPKSLRRISDKIPAYYKSNLENYFKIIMN